MSEYDIGYNPWGAEGPEEPQPEPPKTVKVHRKIEELYITPENDEGIDVESTKNEANALAQRRIESLIVKTVMQLAKIKPPAGAKEKADAIVHWYIKPYADISQEFLDRIEGTILRGEFFPWQSNAKAKSPGA